MIRPAVLCILMGVACHAAEPRFTIDHALSAIVAVESGCTRVGMGQIAGTWTRGQDGEVSPFQLHLSVLQDLGVAGKSARIHRDPVYAESIARLWLGRLHNRYGNWPDAFAAWNGGPNGYKRRMARDYSERVMATAERIAQEQAQ